MLKKHRKNLVVGRTKHLVSQIIMGTSIMSVSVFLYCNFIDQDVKKTTINEIPTIKYKEDASSIYIDLEEEIIPSKLTKSKGKEIVSYAKQFLNTKYVWGGTTPKGFDCSGFVKYVYGKFGIKLNRIAVDQAKEGVYVKKGDYQPGDLVFFDTNDKSGNINHVGIYIGGGEFIQASSKQEKVVISKITDKFYSSSYVTARKIISI